MEENTLGKSQRRWVDYTFIIMDYIMKYKSNRAFLNVSYASGQLQELDFSSYIHVLSKKKFESQAVKPSFNGRIIKVNKQQF